MVKTRHSADAEDLAYGEFITIATSRNRRSEDFDNQVNGYQEDDSEDFEEEVQPRKTRGKLNLTIFGGSTTDDETPPKDRRRLYRENSGPREDTMALGARSLRCHRPMGGRHHLVEDQVINEIRRSGRQRKLTYDTLNQGLINKQLAYLSASEMNGYHEREIQRPNRKRRRTEAEPAPKEEMVDMYTRVKRERPHIKRNMYGVPLKENEGENSNDENIGGDEEDNEDDDDDEEEVDEESEEEEQEAPNSYFLREQRPRTQIYEAPIEPKRNRPRNIFREGTPPQTRPRRHAVTYRSPARRQNIRRRKAAFHGSSSTSSSSSSESSDDERRFGRRKAKSMAKSRQRCLPMNLSQEDVASGCIRDRMKIGSSLADVDPMNIDRSVSFESVGGLGKHVRALKEMVVFPLLYPEVFERFKISPPRGVLFYGPPGTGKTLVARALANECSTGDRKVAFFMRKGADCLSKWVGESERQLRLLFDQAYQMRPAIIFFDEIDGLAPVRSSRQDQIHSSIVSTLLALMDGLDSRGEIVVIGATNRIDSIDPALRRPGRFDREFLFPLPSVKARKQILHIQTNAWNPKLTDQFLGELGEKCVGYCGADLKALCTEAALQALRRRYPQIYNCQDKLQLDVNSIIINAQDFHRAMQVIVPTAQRSVTSPAKALSSVIEPLLRCILNQTLSVLKRIFPSALSQISSVDTPASNDNDGAEEFCSDEEDWGGDIYDQPSKGKGRKKVEACNPGRSLHFTTTAYNHPTTHRPRLLLSGEQGQGQSTHIAPGILHNLERLPVHVMDLPALYAVTAKTPEESCAHIFREAKRTCPSIIYIPHLDHWWEVIGDTLRATFLTLLRDLEPSAPILFMATSDEPLEVMPITLRQLFNPAVGEVVAMKNPSEEARKEYFEDLLLKQATKPPPTRKQAAQRALEVLPKAPPQPPKELTETEMNKLTHQEESTLRELRLFLREVLNKLGRDRKFGLFAKPVDEEEVPDYYQIITKPMDLSTMMNKIDLHQYQTVKEFMGDIELIVSNALEYNPDKDPAGRAIRHRACTLKDTASAILVAELDEDFEKQCEEIKEAKQRRGEKRSANVPSYYFTKPLGQGRQGLMNALTAQEPVMVNRRSSRRQAGCEDRNQPDESVQDDNDDEVIVPKVRTVIRRVAMPRAQKKYRSPWCKPSKRVYRKVTVYLDEHGNEIGQEGNIRATRNELKTDLQNKSNAEEEEEEEEADDDAEKENVDELVEENVEENAEPSDSVEDEKPNKVESEAMDCNVEALKVDTEITDDVLDAGEISPRAKKQGTSPRGRAGPGSPRAGRSPRTDKSPVSSVERGTGKGSRERTKDHKKDTENVSPTRISSNKDTGEDVMDTSMTEKPVENSPETPTKPQESTSPKKGSPTKLPNSANVEEEPVKEEQAPDEPNNTSPQMRVTRSQMHPAQRQKAMEILEECAGDVMVDEGRLLALLNKTVRLTEGCNIEELERLYSMMSQSIYIHRRDCDKMPMLQDLEQALTDFHNYRQ